MSPLFATPQSLMNLHEYQSKEVFREFGIPVPSGKAAKSAPAIRRAMLAPPRSR